MMFRFHDRQDGKVYQATRERRRSEAGITMTEVVVSTALAGMIMAGTTFAWANYERKMSLSVAANMTKLALNQARMHAIFQNVNHFVVLDPEKHEVTVYRDDHAPLGELDDDDSLYSRTTWSRDIELLLPASTETLTDPVSGEKLTEAWSLPESDEGAMAVMLNPLGKMLTVGETPKVIDLGAIVFTDMSRTDSTVSLSIQGHSGSVKSYELVSNSETNETEQEGDWTPQ